MRHTDHQGNQTISVEEAAPLLGVGRDAAYAAAKAGEIPVIRCGKHLRIPLEALKRMLSGGGGVDAAALADEVEARQLRNKLAQLDARRGVVLARLEELESAVSIESVSNKDRRRAAA